MRQRTVWTTLMLVTLTATTGPALAAQPPVPPPPQRTADIMANFDAHVVRHPKTKASTALVKRPATSTKDSVVASVRTTTPVPLTRPRPKAVPRPS